MHIIFFDAGLFYDDTSERYGYPYETIRNITKVLKDNGGGVWYPILQDEHIQWLEERLHVDPNITAESPHCQLNKVFHFPLCFRSHLKLSWIHPRVNVL